jgi:hypothetical protein
MISTLGHCRFHYSQTRADSEEAIRLLERAIALNPTYACTRDHSVYGRQEKGLRLAGLPEG